jgi:hypothetical protein
MKPRLVSVILAASFLYQAGRIVQAQDWSGPVAVMQESKPLISYRARMAGDALALEAVLQSGWHTFSLDNARRAAERLQGKKPLSQDMPTEITVSGGLAIEGAWHQSPPKDFSKPELRWFSWGYDDRAVFAAKVRRTGAGPAQITIRGQVCDASSCRRVDLSLLLPVPQRDSSAEPPDAIWNSVESVH